MIYAQGRDSSLRAMSGSTYGSRLHLSSIHVDAASAGANGLVQPVNLQKKNTFCSLGTQRPDYATFFSFAS